MIRGPHIRKRVNTTVHALSQDQIERLVDACKLIGHERFAKRIGVSGDTLQHARNGFKIRQATADRIVAGLAALEVSQ